MVSVLILLCTSHSSYITQSFLIHFEMNSTQFTQGELLLS